jgi:hypothetical protein
MHFSELMIGDSYCVENVGPAAEGSEQGRNVRLGVLVQKKMIAPHDRGAGSWQYVFSHRETFDDPERFTVCEVSPRDENALDIVCTDLAALDVIHKPTGPTATGAAVGAAHALALLATEGVLSIGGRARQSHRPSRHLFAPCFLP